MKHTPDILGDLLTAPAGAVEIPLELIDDNPFQERSEYGDLTDLAADIREHGLLQPPLARRAAHGRYELAFGHRRKRACELAGLSSMPLVVRALTDVQMATTSFAENEQRRDVSAIDKAVAIQTMITRFGWSVQETADKLSMSRPAVSNLLRLLKLPDEVQAAVSAGEVSVRQAEALITLATLPDTARPGNPYTEKLDSLVASAKTGASSDELRKRADDAVMRRTRELPEHWAGYDFAELEGIEAPKCKGCLKKLLRDDSTRCLVTDCWDRKSQAWQAIEHRELVARVGVPILSEKAPMAEWSYLFRVSTELLGLPHPVGPVAEPCANLRVNRLYNGGWEFVCHHAGAASCACLSKAQKAQTKDGKADWKAVKAATAAALQAVLEEWPLGALRLLAYQTGDYQRQEQIAGWDRPQCIAEIVRGQIQRLQPLSPDDHPDRTRPAMRRLLALAGAVDPWQEAKESNDVS